MRLYRSMAYASAAIAAAWLCWHLSARAAETIALFDPDPHHVSNRLYRQLHVRTDRNGKEHGFDALDPLLWSETNYLLNGKSHARAIALLDEFLSTHAERQIIDPTKRAILQRDLWAVFDWADEPYPGTLAHQAERHELIDRLAPILRSLALSPDELAQLPDTYSHAVQNHEFPSQSAPANPNQAFLPPDLLDPSGPWVCLGAPENNLSAPVHDYSFPSRSVFLVFARLPAGRAATLAYFQQLAEMKTPLFVPMQIPGRTDPMNGWNPEVPQFPIGTEFALLRRLLLPDRNGHLRLTPVTESIQFRHYTDIPAVNPSSSRDINLAKHFQEPSEIDLSRPLLFSPQHSGLRCVTSADDPSLILPAMTMGFDAFEDKRMNVRASSPFVTCTSCHLGPGIQSMMSFSFRANPNEAQVLSPRLAETTPRQEAEKVIQWAQTQPKWKDLLTRWSSDTAH